MRKFPSSTRTVCTGAPQGCVLSPLLFSRYTNDWTSKEPSAKLLKFADDATLIGLIQDRDESAYRQEEVKELAVWCNLNNLELNKLKTVDMIVDFRRNPPALPHSQSWTALWLQWSIQLPGQQNLPGPEVGQSHTLHCQKGPAKAVLPSSAEEIQLATRAADTVLLCHHWIRPLHVNNCLVQLSYQIWPQNTTEGSPDCRANHWYNPPHFPRSVLIQSEQRGWKNHSGPLTSSTLPLWTVAVWSTLQSSEHQNDQTQEQFLPSGNPYHEHLTLIMVHTLFINLYTYLSNTHTKSTFQIAHSMPIHTIVNLYIVIPYLLVLCFFYYLCFCSVSVILLHCGSFMSRKQIPWMCKHTCQ